MSAEPVENIRGAAVEQRKDGHDSYIDVCRQCLQYEHINEENIFHLGWYLTDYGNAGKDPKLEECIIRCDLCSRIF